MVINNKIAFYIFLALAMIFTSIACVEPFKLNVPTLSVILSIDASLSDQNKEQFIVIKKTIPFNNPGATFVSEDKAKVVVVEDNTKNFNCTEGKLGVYYLPLGFKTKVGSTYYLKVTLANGNVYQSSVEKMLNTPDISDSKVIFDKKAIRIGENSRPGHLIYVNTKDNPEKGDNLFWKYRVFENQNTCFSCDGGIYLTSPSPTGSCLKRADLTSEGITYDYTCSSRCWEIFYSTQINVLSDVFSNGNEIKNRLIAQIPFYQNLGFLIEISQQNIDSKAFQFLKQLIEQNQNNGSLIDAPPSPLIGNIKNLNDPKEAVGGYFMVGNIKTKTIWVPRTENEQGSGLLGRPVNNEPSSPGRPPTAPCIKSNTRTPLKPEGWPS